MHVLLGNHEIMNADLDFRYVTPNAWKGWEFDAAQAAKAEEARIPGEVNSLGEALVELGWPSFTKARVDYFRPGGRGSKDEISKMAVALQIGDSVFVHEKDVIQSGLQYLASGMRVRFDVVERVLNNQLKTAATNLMLMH